MALGQGGTGDPLELGLVRVAVVGSVTVTRMSSVARGTGWCTSK